MNINSIQNMEHLNAWAEESLVVDIAPNPLTGYARKAAFFGMNADILNKTISIHVGIFELDENFEVINTKALKPYEDMLVASNDTKVDAQTGEVSETGTIGEFDFFKMVTKNNQIKLWDLFQDRIQNSTRLNAQA